MEIGIVVGVVVSAVILAGLLVTSIWPEPDEQEFERPWMPPKELTAEEREWVGEQLRMTKDDE